MIEWHFALKFNANFYIKKYHHAYLVWQKGLEIKLQRWVIYSFYVAWIPWSGLLWFCIKSLGAEYMRKQTNTPVYSIVSFYQVGPINCNISPEKKMITLPYAVNAMTTDELAMLGARASAAIVLTWLSRNIN